MRRFSAIIRLAFFVALAGFCFNGFCVDLAEKSRIESVNLADLPPEAAQTLDLIKRGGPFPFPRKDGSIFGNFEKRLPERPYGYYREYTVPTPGRHDRGGRRIIAGSGSGGNVAHSGEYYYTDDHYRTFRRIQE